MLFNKVKIYNKLIRIFCFLFFILFFFHFILNEIRENDEKKIFRLINNNK